jgi:hypothetical protein
VGGLQVRLFNLSPDTTIAGMTCSANGTAEIASNVSAAASPSWGRFHWD